MVVLLCTLALAGSGAFHPWHAVHPRSSTADPDHDGLNNAQEFAAHTNWRRPDTDADGWLDGEEVAWGSDPLDGAAGPDDDSDGLYIVQELAAGTDPTVSDTPSRRSPVALPLPPSSPQAASERLMARPADAATSFVPLRI